MYIKVYVSHLSVFIVSKCTLSNRIRVQLKYKSFWIHLLLLISLSHFVFFFPFFFYTSLYSSVSCILALPLRKILSQRISLSLQNAGTIINLRNVFTIHIYVFNKINTSQRNVYMLHFTYLAPN